MSAFSIPITQGRILSPPTLRLSNVQTRPVVIVRPCEFSDGLTTDYIIETVTRTMNVTREGLLGRNKRLRNEWPRQLAMAAAYELTGRSSLELAPLFNRKHHGTILHAIKVVKNRTETEPKAKAQWDSVLQALSV